MIIITGIEPRYVITKDQDRNIVSIQVSFSYRKKQASSETLIELSGCLTFPCEDPVIDLKALELKIVDSIFNTPTQSPPL